MEENVIMLLLHFNSDCLTVITLISPVHDEHPDILVVSGLVTALL